MIREARISDLDILIELSIEALQIDPYPSLLISKEKIKHQLIRIISGAPHFAWVSTFEGKVVGGLLALISDMFVYERSEACVVMWYCRKKGDGLKLMDEFMSWADGRPMIKQIEYCGERNGDPRIVAYMCRKYGFMNDVPLVYKI